MTWQNTLSNLLTRRPLAHTIATVIVAIPHDYVKRRKLGGARISRLTFDARSISDPWRDPSVSSRWHNHVSRLIIGPHPRSCRERERERSRASRFACLSQLKGTAVSCERWKRCSSERVDVVDRVDGFWLGGSDVTASRVNPRRVFAAGIVRPHVRLLSSSLHLENRGASLLIAANCV